jgi:hypothetical protein
MALPLCLAVAIGVVPALWTSVAEAQEADESEASADDSPAPTIYKWIDEHGIAHYTTDFDRIPRGLRNRAGRLGPPDAAMRRERVDPSAPARRTSPSPAAGDAEQWAVRDSPADRPKDAWDEGDPYGYIAAPELGEEDGFLSESELEERRQRLEDIDARIASLQIDIAASEETLKTLVAIPVAAGGGPLAMADDPTFREVADRLPKLLDDLRALEDERAQLEAPSAGPP